MGPFCLYDPQKLLQSLVSRDQGLHLLNVNSDSKRQTCWCAGSTQGIGLGMLRGLADAGADVVMHGLVSAEDAKARTADIAKEFGVQCRHSAADVTKPAEIR